MMDISLRFNESGLKDGRVWRVLSLNISLPFHEGDCITCRQFMRLKRSILKCEESLYMKCSGMYTSTALRSRRQRETITHLFSNLNEVFTIGDSAGKLWERLRYPSHFQWRRMELHLLCVSYRFIERLGSRGGTYSVGQGKQGRRQGVCLPVGPKRVGSWRRRQNLVPERHVLNKRQDDG
jgi:hypothetical protein